MNRGAGSRNRMPQKFHAINVHLHVRMLHLAWFARLALWRDGISSFPLPPPSSLAPAKFCRRSARFAPRSQTRTQRTASLQAAVLGERRKIAAHSSPPVKRRTLKSRANCVKPLRSSLPCRMTGVTLPTALNPQRPSPRTGRPDVIPKEAWPCYRTVSGVRLCWELEEPK